MEATICYLALSLGLVIAASLNYRRSVLAAYESVRLHQEAKEAYDNAQKHYQEALQARLEARQTREQAVKALEDLKYYWQLERLN